MPASLDNLSVRGKATLAFALVCAREVGLALFAVNVCVMVVSDDDEDTLSHQ